MRFKKFNSNLKLKTAEQMERHFKGMSNHYRIEILLLIDKNNGITVDDITIGVNGNFKTISQHTRYLVQSGLVNKKYAKQSVTHRLSPYGKFFVKFIKDFQKIN